MKFKRLFSASNPTHTWPPRSAHSLTFDMRECSLNGAAVGQPFESLSFLGPDERRESIRGGQFSHCYYSLGLCVECLGDEHLIASFQIVLRDPEEQEYQPFTGRIIHNGCLIDLDAVTVDRCVELFGEYYWLDRGEDESIVFYEFTDREWQLEFDDRSSLSRLIVTSQPLMADEEQRKAFTVTKSWPAGKVIEQEASVENEAERTKVNEQR